MSIIVGFDKECLEVLKNEEDEYVAISMVGLIPTFIINVVVIRIILGTVTYFKKLWKSAKIQSENDI